MTEPASVPTAFMGSGIKQDLHTLFVKFLSTQSNKIRDFADVFRELQFESVLHFKISPAEYVEFVEFFLQNAALYFGKENEVKAIRTFTERIFGIYVCYAVYNLQPVDHICQIPVTHMQFQELLEFQEVLISSKELEPLCALKSLLLKKAFRLMVFQSTYDPATHKRYLAEEEMPDFGTEKIEPFARVKAVQNHQTIGELSYIHNAYISAKKKIGMADIQMVDKLNPPEEFQKHLEKNQEELHNIRKRMENEIDDTLSVDLLPQTAGSSRSELRSRAYAAEMKHTRNRRYLDPNMEENFKNIATFKDIAQQCLNEPTESNTSKRKPKRKRVAIKPETEQIDDDALAEQVLRDEYASRVKPEIPELEEQAMFGNKKQGTSGVSRLRAPPKKKAINLVEVKTERRPDAADKAGSSFDKTARSPPRKKSVAKSVPRVSDEWASRLHTFNGAVAAADKQMKKLQSQIKIEPVDAQNP